MPSSSPPKEDKIVDEDGEEIKYGLMRMPSVHAKKRLARISKISSFQNSRGEPSFDLKKSFNNTTKSVAISSDDEGSQHDKFQKSKSFGHKRKGRTIRMSARTKSVKRVSATNSRISSNSTANNMDSFRHNIRQRSTSPLPDKESDTQPSPLLKLPDTNTNLDTLSSRKGAVTALQY